MNILSQRPEPVQSAKPTIAIVYVIIIPADTTCSHRKSLRDLMCKARSTTSNFIVIKRTNSINVRSPSSDGSTSDEYV